MSSKLNDVALTTLLKLIDKESITESQYETFIDKSEDESIARKINLQSKMLSTGKISINSFVNSINSAIDDLPLKPIEDVTSTKELKTVIDSFVAEAKNYGNYSDFINVKKSVIDAAIKRTKENKQEVEFSKFLKSTTRIKNRFTTFQSVSMNGYAAADASLTMYKEQLFTRSSEMVKCITDYMKTTPIAQRGNTSLWIQTDATLYKDAGADNMHVTNNHRSSSKKMVINQKTSIKDFERYVAESIDVCIGKLEMFTANGSDWNVLGIQSISINFYSSGEAGGTYLDLPPAFMSKTSLRNLKTPHDQCFKYACIISINKDEKVTDKFNYRSYQSFAEYNLFSELERENKIVYPVSLDAELFKTVEDKLGASIDVYELTGNDEFPLRQLYLTKRERNTRAIYLLYLNDKVNDISHFVAITNLNGIFYAPGNSHNARKTCPQCLGRIMIRKGDTSKYEAHLKECRFTLTPSANSDGETRRKKKEYTICPITGDKYDLSKTISKFDAFAKKVPPPFVVYGDFESCIVKKDIDEVSYGSASTSKISVHEPSSYCFMVTNPKGQVVKTIIHRSDKCEANFYPDVIKLGKWVRSELAKTYSTIPDMKSKCTHCGEHFANLLDAGNVERGVSDKIKFYQTLPKFMRYDTANTAPIDSNMKVTESVIGMIHNSCKQKRFKEFTETNTCWICENDLDNTDHKIMDFCTISGKYRGAAHVECVINNSYNEFTKVPVYFHNLESYDSHHIINSWSKANKADDVYIIAKNKEKVFVIDFKATPFKFIDSYHFLSGSLEKLAESFSTSLGAAPSATLTPEELRKYEMAQLCHYYPAISNVFGIISRKGLLDSNIGDVNIPKKDFLDLPHWKMMLRKNIIPYEMLTDHAVFDMPAVVPKEAFSSCLTNYEAVSDKDYNFFGEFRDAFKISTLGEYQDIYLLIDVALTADIINGMRQLVMKHFHLDPAHYITLPALSIHAAMHESGKDFKLELLNDLEMYTFFEADPKRIEMFPNDPQHLGMIRGGICQANIKYTKASNKILRGDYVELPDDNYILYLDANALYSRVMQMKLPYKDFKWGCNDMVADMHEVLVSLCDTVQKNIKANGHEYHCALEDIHANDTQNKFKIPLDTIVAHEPIYEIDSVGAFFEVDLEYPAYLHEYFNDLPPAPNVQEVTEDLLSSYQKNIYSAYQTKHNAKTKKLICSLIPKTFYKIHYLELELYINLGVVVTCVHRMVTFTEREWLKPYIDKCVTLRRLAKTKFQKDMPKLMANSVFGKTMEKVRSRKAIELMRDRTDEDCAKIISKLRNSLDFKIDEVTEDMMMIQVEREYTALDKPVYTGAAILSLSKMFMYSFFYNKLKRIYNDRYDTPLQLQRVRLIYQDTDSNIVSIRTGDVYRDMIPYKSCLFDMSEYPKDHILYDESNKLIPGPFKDESKGKVISEIVALSPKMYSTMCDDNSIKKAKGIKEFIVKHDIKHSHFVDAFEKCQIYNTLISLGYDFKDINAYRTNTLVDKEILLDEIISNDPKFNDFTIARDSYKIMLDNNFTHSDIEKIKVISNHRFLSNDLETIALMNRFRDCQSEKKIPEDILDKLDLMSIQKFNLQHSFRSYNHKINTVQIFKAGIGCKDNKRYICADGNDSYPFGSMLIDCSRKAAEKI